MQNRISLEPEAVAVCDANAKPPLIFQLPPCKGRKVLEEAQSTPVHMYPADVREITVNTGEWGEIPVYIVCPEHISSPSNVIFYIHGAGWVFGSFHTHEKLVRELAARTHSVLVFPVYSRSPEVRYPMAIEQCYHVLCRLPALLENMNISMNPCTLKVAGDSVGGNMAIAMTIMAKQRKEPYIQKQLLFYPVTNACFGTASYHQFARGVLSVPGGYDVVLGSVYRLFLRQNGDHGFSPAGGSQPVERAAGCHDHQWRGRRAAGRGGGICPEAAEGGGGCHRTEISGNDPRFCYVECPGSDKGMPGRHGLCRCMDQS